jgi:hypothetical protein
MKHFTLNALKLLFLMAVIIYPLANIAMDGGGGGGTGFTDGMPGGSVGCGSLSLDISKASVASQCDPVDAKHCPGPGGTNTYADCQYTANNAGVCKHSTCTCIGSMENNIWAQFCAPATGTFVFETTNVSCSGGGSSLQFVIWDAAPTNSICDIENNVVFCNNNFTANKSYSVNLTSGTCYTLMFDGNAGAACTFTFTIDCQYVLSTYMLDYDVKLSNDKTSTLFKWKVADEEDVSHYEIQRSSNGKDFESVGKVYGKNVDGQVSYSYEDGSTPIGLSYYRLKQVQKDGTEFIYKKVPIHKRVLEANIYPNPIKSDLNIDFGKDLEAGTEIAVYDILGGLVYKTELTQRSSSIKIDMDGCTKGMYFLSIRSGDALMQQKFYKD